MEAYSSILAWKIPLAEEPGGLQSMGFPRQEFWSVLPFPSPGNLPNPGIKSTSPGSPALAGGLLFTEPPGKPQMWLIQSK